MASTTVMDKCWNPSRRAFTAHPDTEVLDPGGLGLPTVLNLAAGRAFTPQGRD